MEITTELFDEIIVTMGHARLFINTREKMHPTGINLYDNLLERLNKEDWRNQSNFCKCGQVKHVGFDKCVDCLNDNQVNSTCPHCGEYCTGKSVFCNPPIEES